MNCPRCNSKNVRRSGSGNAGLLFPLTLFMVWMRCTNCWRKFPHFGFLPGSKISDGRRVA
jgi:transposase-like protein